MQPQKNTEPFISKDTLTNIYWIVGIFSLAVILRLIYFFEIKDTPVLQQLYIDSDYYQRWAVSISQGDILGGKKIFSMAPLYAYFLAFIYFVFQTTNYLYAIATQLFIGSLSCVLLYLVGNKYFTRHTGIFAGIIGAIYPIFL